VKTLVGIVLLGMTLAVTGCASDSNQAEEGVIEVEAVDHKFVPDELDAEAGSISFAIRNTGQEIHEFEVFEGKKLIDEVEDISPGLTRELTVSLEAGTYEYACKFEDHYERGMKGTLTVT
jgi:iron uptake system component EfeO